MSRHIPSGRIGVISRKFTLCSPSQNVRKWSVTNGKWRIPGEVRILIHICIHLVPGVYTCVYHTPDVTAQSRLREENRRQKKCRSEQIIKCKSDRSFSIIILLFFQKWAPIVPNCIFSSMTRCSPTNFYKKIQTTVFACFLEIIFNLLKPEVSHSQWLWWYGVDVDLVRCVRVEIRTFGIQNF